MSTEIHFLDVGCGNMVLMLLPNGSVFFYDCNLTDKKEVDVLEYLEKVMGHADIDVFINSHRDADHMRGIKTLHGEHTIKEIWDTGVPGTTTNTPEYREYMDMLRKVTSKTIKPRKYWTYGKAKLRCMNAAWEDYTEPNEQSVVLKVEHNERRTAMLAGDTNCRPWKEKILTFYADANLKSTILLGAHHGSITFFDAPSDDKYYYEAHISKLKPAMSLISVGPNPHGLPDKKALELYEKHSTGSDKGNKVYTTEKKGNMRLILKDDGGWTLYTNQ